MEYNLNGNKINSYLTFMLGNELFAAHVSKVLTILEVLKITRVPQSPAYMMGIINFRGSVLPVIDTKIKCGMNPVEIGSDTCILVLEILSNDELVEVGVIVDSVQEVIELNEKEMLPVPTIGSKYRSEYIENVAKVNDDFIMILNMDALFSVDEVVRLKQNLSDCDKIIEEPIG
jgi:purine-binding chemotaxis protein CheW